jgi:hypothetical protein
VTTSAFERRHKLHENMSRQECGILESRYFEFQCAGLVVTNVMTFKTPATWPLLEDVQHNVRRECVL